MFINSNPPFFLIMYHVYSPIYFSEILKIGLLK